MSEIFYAVMVMDGSRRRGGLAVVPKGNAGAPVEIRIGPLVRVHGQFEGPEAGKAPGWTHVYTLLPPDPARPLHTNRLVSCGSFEGRFAMSLPAGRYLLQAYNEQHDAELVPDKEIDLSDKQTDVDLGVLRLLPSGPSMEERVKKSKANGAWGDYTKHFGEQPPRWHINDARGVSKDVQLSDLKGKWVLLDFWGFGCRPCLWTGLPKLVKFYEEHAAERDRFEILAICLDYDGELKTMADVDRQLAPIVEHVLARQGFAVPGHARQHIQDLGELWTAGNGNRDPDRPGRQPRQGGRDGAGGETRRQEDAYFEVTEVQRQGNDCQAQLLGERPVASNTFPRGNRQRCARANGGGSSLCCVCE